MMCCVNFNVFALLLVMAIIVAIVTFLKIGIAIWIAFTIKRHLVELYDTS